MSDGLQILRRDHLEQRQGRRGTGLPATAAGDGAMTWWKVRVGDVVVAETENRNDANDAFFALVRCQTEGTIVLSMNTIVIARSDA